MGPESARNNPNCRGGNKLWAFLGGASKQKDHNNPLFFKSWAQYKKAQFGIIRQKANYKDYKSTPSISVTNQMDVARNMKQTPKSRNLDIEVGVDSNSWGTLEPWGVSASTSDSEGQEFGTISHNRMIFLLVVSSILYQNLCPACILVTLGILASAYRTATMH